MTILELLRMVEQVEFLLNESIKPKTHLGRVYIGLRVPKHGMLEFGKLRIVCLSELNHLLSS